MFGKPTGFGSATSTPAFGSTSFGGTSTTGFGANTSFGAPNQTAPSAFGTPAFGAANTTQPAAGGGLFGQPGQQPAAGGGLFGQPAASTGGFGTGGSAFGGNTSFGATSAFSKPGGGGFGTSSTGGSLFGSSTTTSTSGGLFGSATNTGQSAFGATTGTAFGGTGSAFGSVGGQNAPVGTTVKFQPPTGCDTMMKNNTTTTINTRHQCISCMKEYESKSLEELRCEDYLANRKGGGQATGMSGGLFGAAPASQSNTGGFFGSGTTTNTSTGGLFGGGQQNKPLFGGGGGGFGAATTSTTPFGSTGFGATSTAGTSGGLFGNKPAGFGAPTSNTGFGFGNTATNTGGGLFGQNQNKPVGFGTPTTQSGGLFGSTGATGGFGQTTSQPSAFGAPSTGFGMQNQQQSSIGLFGQQQQQNKPAFGFGATATSSAAPSFGFGTTTTQAAATPFGQTKPAFGAGGGFGATSTPSFGFGTNTQTQQSGGLFGNAQKPTLSFGTQPTSQPATGFGGFGASGGLGTTTGGGLFGAGAQNKPGGLFGGGTGTAFGTGTGFGTSTSTGFGGSFGGGGSFGATNPAGGFLGGSAVTQPLQQQQQPASSNVIQQQLIQFSTSPYGDNPLFKNLMDSGKKDEILKPINPVAQKALGSDADQQYKVSPHRNIKAKAKPISSVGNKSAIFDGLEDDDINTKNELFVPRSSIKKLVLKPKSSPKTNNDSQEEGANNSIITSPAPPNVSLHALGSSFNRTIGEESFSLPKVKVRDDVSKKNGPEVNIEESFTVLNPQKKQQSKAVSPPLNVSSDANKIGTPSQQNISVISSRHSSGADETELLGPEQDNHPAKIVLRRAGYYTIPSLQELANMVDSNGDCKVDNFTVGRNGYGNVFFPGVTNVANLNLDEIVFIRHKEVIVYPDDNKKPELGQGLNKKAQVTLDKVWPVDKTTKSNIRSPEKLAAMSYEDKLQKACLKLGARFVEYRVETGSWVFKVDHFSKYGLEDSDEEEQPKTDVKKLKTLQLREPLKPKELNTNQEKDLKLLESEKSKLVPKPPSQFESERQDSQAQEPMRDEDAMETMSPAVQQLAQARASKNRVQLMKASLFDDGEEDMETSSPVVPKPTSRPVILEARPTILEKRDSLIEDIAHSMLTGSSSGKGLGGSFSLDQSLSHQTSAASNLLRSRFLGSQRNDAVSIKHPLPTYSAKTPSKVPNYTLHAGYDKYVRLSTSGLEDQAKTIVPRFANKMKPFDESLFNFKRLYCIADSSLAMSRHFRVGWAPHWRLASAGLPSNVTMAQRKISDVHVARVNMASFDSCNESKIDSVSAWLDLNLGYSEVRRESNDIPKIEVTDGVEILHAHAEEVKRQLNGKEPETLVFINWLKEVKQIWDLCVALWGRLREQDILGHGEDTHEVTMLRKEAVTEWLKETVKSDVKAAINEAKEKGCPLEEVLALLSGNLVSEACEKAQENGDHFAAILMATSGGHNSINGQLVFQQLERWQEARADKHIPKKRLQLYTLLAGLPVWNGSKESVNVCEDLDWKRAFAMHLWYLTSPVSSVGDAFLGYEQAFQSEDEAYAEMPKPAYETGNFSLYHDVKYHLLKLYTQRSHSLESLLNPATHTSDYLDYSVSWFLARVLKALGYRHLSPEKDDEIHLNFSAQLESIGLWHWSIFVLLHLTDSDFRMSKVKEILCRHIRLSDEECLEKEMFLQDELRVPSSWIEEAKAIRGRVERVQEDEEE